MTHEQQAAKMSQDEIVSLLIDRDRLQQQVEWFKRQLFGSSSERRVIDPDGRQMTLGEEVPAQEPSSAEITIAAHRRRRRHARLDDAADESKVRFDPQVPVVRIDVPPDVPVAERYAYEVIDEKITHRLAQRPGVYVVLEYRRPVLKRKVGTEESIVCAPAPPAVLEKSLADVSVLTGLLVDKLIYHLPLYRQHQRLAAAGVHLSRVTLTNWVHRTAELLEPIHDALLHSILEGGVVTMDETPIRVGPKKNKPPGRRRMQTGYFWPVYGDRDEVAFPFAPTRAGSVVREVLGDYTGVLLTDGYDVYDRYAARTNDLVHAQCWTHTRRGFDQATEIEPELADAALDRIGQLYEVEAQLKRLDPSPEQVLAHRAEHSKPIVEELFEWLRTLRSERTLLPTSPFTKAMNYALAREEGLKVFLAFPDVPIDTNHLERALRVIALGRKNWLFCWTEVGARCVGIVQSLLSTCRLHGVDPYTYLVDVLQRIEILPATQVDLLIPRLWKQHFAADPLRSDLDRILEGEFAAASQDAVR